MSPSALLLVLTAAVLHTGWNMLLKQTRDTYLVMWWALFVGSLLFLPGLAFGEPLPPWIWPYILASAMAEAAYFGILATAYRSADFSLVYPIARGTAPALLNIWSFLWFGQQPGLAGLLGLSLIVIGLMIVGSSAWWSRKPEHLPPGSAIGLALLVALCISGYSLIDGAAVQHVSAAPYIALVFLTTSLLTTPLMLWRYGTKPLLGVWRSDPWRTLAIGVLMLVSYLLVVAAFTLAPVGYVGAIREISVVLAALAGWMWLGEGFGIPRIIGAALLFSGIVTIAIFG